VSKRMSGSPNVFLILIVQVLTIIILTIIILTIIIQTIIQAMLVQMFHYLDLLVTLQ